MFPTSNIFIFVMENLMVLCTLKIQTHLTVVVDVHFFLFSIFCIFLKLENFIQRVNESKI